MKLKKEYEMTFKEGLRLGMRLTQAKAYIQSARDAKRLGDDTMAELYMGFAKDWNDLARNAGRRFTPIRPCLLYTSPSPRDGLLSRMPSSA